MKLLRQDIVGATEKAQEVLTAYWDDTLPVDPQKIAKKMGITIKAISHEGCSGKACKENGESAVIEYDNTELPLRQRFTIAHELGHHVLNHTSNGHHFRDEISQFKANVRSPTETQANKFAAELLAPEIAIKHYVFKKNITSIETLARLFKISSVAMKYRLKNLGMI